MRNLTIQRTKSDNDIIQVEQCEREKKTKHFIIFLVVAISIVAFLAAFVFHFCFLLKQKEVNDNAVEKEQTIENGKIFVWKDMAITLPEDFNSDIVSDRKITYTCDDIRVSIWRYAIPYAIQDKTPAQYAQMTIENNRLNTYVETKSESLTYYIYSDPYWPSDGMEDYKFVCYVYKSEEAFWTIQVATPKDKFDERIAEIELWARSVQFSN